MSNSLSRHVDGHLWLKLIPLLCRQLPIRSARQTDFTPRTASKWRGTAEASLCSSFLSSFTPNCNLISVYNNTHILYTPTPTLNLHPLNKGGDLVTWWDWDYLELLICVFSEARHTGTSSGMLSGPAVFSDWRDLTGLVSFFHKNTEVISLGQYSLCCCQLTLMASLDYLSVVNDLGFSCETLTAILILGKADLGSVRLFGSAGQM